MSSGMRTNTSSQQRNIYSWQCW